MIRTIAVYCTEHPNLMTECASTAEARMVYNIKRTTAPNLHWRVVSITIAGALDRTCTMTSGSLET